MTQHVASTPPYAYEDDSARTRAVLERFYEAERAYVAAGGPGRADFSALAACLAPDVVLHQSPGLPYAGAWRGPAGMERFMAVMGRLWRSMQFLEQRQLVDGEEVVVTSRVRFTARATGRVLTTTIVQLMTVRDGRIREVRPFYWDPAAVAETCGQDAVREVCGREAGAEPFGPGAGHPA
ncbi:ketosteroid isomerase [Streptomyces sp. WAC 06725]|uniref:nuclear transport factor 2 family protein n=1 Tax=Streptomyces sp. WAC 06725 TaxID=2203209 RepID=UPI000F74137C|nr:nuclear transport factor 2 family protein [Streptomyces sp. WAC 06725]RSO44120.1 ketosteroid isomerase [Streptomyces sp. WAC 06725]